RGLDRFAHQIPSVFAEVGELLRIQEQAVLIRPSLHLTQFIPATGDMQPAAPVHLDHGDLVAVDQHGVRVAVRGKLQTGLTPDPGSAGLRVDHPGVGAFGGGEDHDAVEGARVAVLVGDNGDLDVHGLRVELIKEAAVGVDVAD